MLLGGPSSSSASGAPFDGRGATALPEALPSRRYRCRGERRGGGAAAQAGAVRLLVSMRPGDERVALLRELESVGEDLPILSCAAGADAERTWRRRRRQRLHGFGGAVGDTPVLRTTRWCVRHGYGAATVLRLRWPLEERMAGGARARLLMEGSASASVGGGGKANGPKANGGGRAAAAATAAAAARVGSRARSRATPSG